MRGLWIHASTDRGIHWFENPRLSRFAETRRNEKLLFKNSSTGITDQ